MNGKEKQGNRKKAPRGANRRTKDSESSEAGGDDSNPSTSSNDLDFSAGTSAADKDDAEGETGIKAAAFKKMVKEKIASGEYIAEGKPSGLLRQTKTDFWDCFLQVKVAATKSNVDAVECKGCREVFIYRGHTSGSSAVSRHIKRNKCPGGQRDGIPFASALTDPPAAAKVAFSEECAHFCAQDLRPPNALAGEGLINLVQKAIDLALENKDKGRIDARKLVPHPRTVSNKIASEASVARQCLMEEVLPALQEKRCAATTDGWTEQYRSDHLSNIVFHFLKDWELKTRLVFSISVEGASSHEELKEFLIEKLIEVGVPQELIDFIVFVTDGGADIVKALKEFRRLYCMCHALNIVVRTAFSVKYADLIERVIKSSPLATSIIQEANEWVKFVRSKLPKKHPLLKELKVTVPQSQSHTLMLKAIRDLRDQVETAARIDYHDPGPMSDVETETVASLIDFLHPFDLTGGREPSPSVSASKLPLLHAHLEDKADDCEMILALKSTARQELEVMEAVATIDKCKALVAYFKRSGSNAELSRTLKQEVETRWNSFLTMLESVDTSWEEVEKVLEAAKAKKSKSRSSSTAATAKLGSGVPDLASIDKILVKNMIDFLSKFRTFSQKLEGSKYPTLPYALPVFECLRQHCQPKSTDCNVMAAIREKALFLLHDKVQIQMEHKVACLLWPQMKTLASLTDEERQEVHAYVRERIRILREGRETEADEPAAAAGTPNETATTAAKNSDMDLFGFLMVKKSSTQVDELQQYLDMAESEVPSSMALLTWWKIHGSIRFPLLSKVAEQILPIPAASAESERNWSDAKILISAKATNMHSPTVDNTLVLRDHLRNNLKRKRSDE